MTFLDPRTWFRSVDPTDPDNPLVTSSDLLSLVPSLGQSKASEYAQALSKAAAVFEINTPKRIAYWLAQLCHESDHFRTMEEYASGAAYEGRADLGNFIAGDGKRFKGHGWIQITGRANHEACGKRFGRTAEEVIDWLQTPTGAAMGAAWFWHSRGLNDLADADDVLGISVRINGRNRATGLPNGWDDRVALSEKAKQALEVA